MPCARSQSSAVAISAAAASPSSASNMPHWPVPGAHMLEHQVVDLGADPADDPAVALGQPQLRLGMLEPGVLLRVDQAVNLVLQRRHPGRIVLVDVPGEVDEGLAVGLGLDGADG